MQPLTANRLDINHLNEIRSLAGGMQFFRVPAPPGRRIGVPLDNVIRERWRTRRTSDRRTSCAQAARMAAPAHGSVPDLLRHYDHADRGAGGNDRIAARAHSRTVQGQRRIVCRSKVRAGRRPGFSREVSVSDNAKSFVDSVRSGSGKAGPVIPGSTAGSTAAPDAESAENAVSDAVQAGVRP